MNDLERIWPHLLDSLRPEVSNATWNTWFSCLQPVALNDSRLTIAVPNAIVRDRIQAKYLSLITSHLCNITSEPTEVLFKITAEQTADGQPPNPALTPTAPTQRALPQQDTLVPASPVSLQTQTRETLHQPSDTPLNPRYTFDTFIIGASNRFSHAAALSVAEKPSGPYNPLFIYGGAGLGKTHLLHAIGNYTHQTSTTLRVKYISTETFMNEFIDAIRTTNMPQFKRRYRECDVLLIDDIQFLENTEKLQEEFFHTFNSLYAASKQIVITSDRSPRFLSTLEYRLRTRFMSGLITEVQAPELETRLAILHAKAARDNLQLNPDILQFIAQNVTDNIRELEGAVTRVSAFATLNNQSLTLEQAQELLNDIILSPSRRSITPELILDHTAKQFGFTVDDLRGSSRRRPLVTARHISMYVFRELTDYSYPAIAREFGGRDHATVMYAVEKISELMKERRPIYNQVTHLIQSIRGAD